MLILLSPTKKQRTFNYEISDSLLFNDLKENLVSTLKTYDIEEIKNRYKVSDKLANDTLERFQNYEEKTTALFTYNGDAFTSLDPLTLSSTEIEYANEHLMIFSALYGLLKPLNRISLYRLDMLTKLDLSLYHYWSKEITKHLNNLNRPIINLASQEFSLMINEKDLNVPITHIGFYNRDQDGNLKVVSSHAKKARGAFARVLIKSKPTDLKSIVVHDYKFSHIENESLFIFIKE